MARMTKFQIRYWNYGRGEKKVVKSFDSLGAFNIFMKSFPPESEIRGRFTLRHKDGKMIIDYKGSTVGDIIKDVSKILGVKEEEWNVDDGDKALGDVVKILTGVKE
jgi:hypothetical protein